MLSAFSNNSRRTMTRERRLQLVKSYASDWVVTIAFAGAAAGIDKVSGFRREFSIDDTSLRFPYATHERVPSFALYLICVVAPFTLQALVNILNIRSWWDFHIGSLGLAFSLSLTAFVTAVVKSTVGRPRPDVIARCMPPLNITNPEYGLVSSAICTQTNEAILRDGFESFPSGHASLSFAGLAFLSFYLAGKFHIFNLRGYTVRVWITFIPLLGASLVAISRTMDYRHHWQDVLVGSLLGFLVAFFSYRQYYPPLNSDLCHKPFSPRIKRDAIGILPLEDEPNHELPTPILPIAHNHDTRSSPHPQGVGQQDGGLGSSLVDRPSNSRVYSHNSWGSRKNLQPEPAQQPDIYLSRYRDSSDVSEDGGDVVGIQVNGVK